MSMRQHKSTTGTHCFKYPETRQIHFAHTISLLHGVECAMGPMLADVLVS